MCDTDNISELVPDILAKDASTSAFSAADTSRPWLLQLLWTDSLDKFKMNVHNVGFYDSILISCI